MATHKHIDAICIMITVFTLLFTILFMNGKSLGIDAIPSKENSNAMFTENDLDTAWDTENATEIILSDKGSTVHGNGAYISNKDVYIVYAGKYIVSGELSDGTIRIKADGDDKIWLMLNNVSIHCENDAAIRIDQAGKVFLTLQTGTTNLLSSGTSYDAEAMSASVDGTIYSKDDLTIGGAGSLRVTAKYRHGIVCNDDLVITGGTIEITAPQDSIHANDSVRIKEANIALTAGDDGITVSNDEETAFFYIESGIINIPSCNEGIEAVQITIAGGKLNIAAVDDGLNANGFSGNSVINITGGNITVTVESGRDADGIDSNKDIYISGGKLFVSVSDNGGNSAIDYGSESNGKCEISGGTVLACGGSGMAQGFDSSSTQGFLMQTALAKADTTVTVKDNDGNELVSESIPYSFSSVLVSTPEMKIGDTYTLFVGDNKTEITIDNIADFGEFTGGKRPGENGFGAGRGDISGNKEIFGNKTNNFINENESTQGKTEQSAQSVVQTVKILNTDNSATQSQTDETSSFNGQDKNETQGSPENNVTNEMQPPEMPNGMNEGAPPNPPQNEMNGDQAQPNVPTGGGDFKEQFGDNKGNMKNYGNDSQPTNTETPIPAEEILLLCISLVVLLCGCIIAFFYKRR